LIGCVRFGTIAGLVISNQATRGDNPVLTRPSLLVRVRDVRDAEAWRTFVTIYAPIVLYRYARRHGLQDADAADVTQEVMGEVAQAIRSFEYRPERGRFRDWLRTIARRRLARFKERQARCPEHPYSAAALEWVSDGDDPTDVDWEESFNVRVLRTALRRIQPCFEPMTWRAFERVWLEDRSAAETAVELSLRIELVYVAKSRVLKRLEEVVQEIAGDFSWLDAIEVS
jgi:RNA polymerase sigma factor (sigma-70 family)